MATKKKEPVLNDRERILSSVVRGLMSTQLSFAAKGDGYHSATYRDRNGWEYVHFAYDQKPVKGDLVIAQSSIYPNRWTIGWFESGGNHEYVIREIGTGMLCNYSNETFVPIRGLQSTELLEGKERAFYFKVLKALRQGGEYRYTFGGIKFNGPDVNVTIRERYNDTVPFDVVIPYQPRMSITKIVALLREGGYGTREFEKLPS